MTKSYLMKVYNQIQSEFDDQKYSTKVTISNFVSHPKPFNAITNPMTPQSWKEVYDQGLENTKITITFLAGFLDLLKSLFDPPSNT